MENENPMEAWVPQSANVHGRIHHKQAREGHETQKTKIERSLVGKASYSRANKDQYEEASWLLWGLEEYPRNIKPLSDKEQNYAKKFGLLKKACVMFSYERYKDAFELIAEAAEIVKAENKIILEAERALAAKWKFRLGLPPKLDLTDHKDKILKEEVITERFVNSLDLGDIDAPKVVTFINRTIKDKERKFSKNEYLSNQIELFYLQVDGKLWKQMKDIKKVKERVGQLEEIFDMQETG